MTTLQNVSHRSRTKSTENAIQYIRLPSSKFFSSILHERWFFFLHVPIKIDQPTRGNLTHYWTRNAYINCNVTGVLPSVYLFSQILLLSHERFIKTIKQGVGWFDGGLMGGWLV